MIEEALLTTTTVKSTDDKSTNQRVEERLPVTGLTTDVDEKSKVTQAVSTKISDALYYGDGKWDKIPYTVEVFSSVTVTCDQSEEKIALAQRVAHQMAFESSQLRMRSALIEHVSDMRNNIFRSMFDGD